MMKLWGYVRLLVLGVALQASPAAADWLYTPGNGPSKFMSFNASSSPVAGTGACAATNVDCMVFSPVNPAGSPLFSTTPGAVALNATPSLANGSGVVPTQGGSVLSATNGGFNNVLQGNAALSATNGLFSNILQGNAVLSATNPIFGRITDGTTAVPVKAASTAAATTDPAFVVAVSPNNTLPVNTTQVNGTARSVGTGAVGTGTPRIAVGGDSAVLAGSALGLTTGSPLFITPGTSALFAQNTTQIGGNSIVTGGVNGSQGVGGVGAAGSALAGNPVRVSGSDGTNARDFLTDAGGRLVNIGGQPTSTAMQAAAVANGNGTVLTVTGYGVALVNVNCSVACAGGTTVNFEGTDSTGTFFSVAAYPIAGGTPVSTATTTGQFLVPVTGLTSVRARISAYSAGTITVTGTAFYGSFPAVGSGSNTAASATGSAVPANAGYAGINVGGTLRGQTGVNPTGSVFAGQTDLASMGGTSIAAGCVASLSGLSTTTIPATVCPWSATYVLNTLAAIGNNADGVAAAATSVSPVGSYNFVYNGSTWDRVRSGSVTGSVLSTLTSQYPTGGVPLTATNTGTTAATTATLAASASGLKTYLCGYSIRANATAAATGNATVTGPVTGTLNFTQWTAPNASGLGINEQIFTPCVPSSATNTAIAVISAAPGAGGVVSVTAWGYQGT